MHNIVLGQMSVNERWANNVHAATTTTDQYRPAAAAAAAARLLSATPTSRTSFL